MKRLFLSYFISISPFVFFFYTFGSLREGERGREGEGEREARLLFSY